MTRTAIVVGGGLAGLSAGAALAARGVRVTLLEARPHLGGRVSTFTDPVTGERIDNGQHILLGCYQHTFEYLRRIGSANQVPLDSRLALEVIDRSGTRSQLSCPSLPPPWHLLAGIATWPALTWRDRFATARMDRALRPSCAPLQTETVRAWLVRHGQTARVIEVLWEPLALAALNQPVDVAAAGPFATVLARMFTGNKSNAALALPRVPLDEALVDPAREYIERHGGEVRTGVPARIEMGSSRSGAVRVTLKDASLEAGTVICAVPWHALPDVLRGAEAGLARIVASAATTSASPIVTVNLWFDRRVLGGKLVGLPGRRMQWAFDKGLVFDGRATHVSLVSSGAEDIVSADNDEIVDEALRELREVLPGVSHARFIRGLVVRERRATFSLAPDQPPRPGTETTVPGLMLAGDWIDTGLPATIESAVESGHRAAACAWSHLVGQDAAVGAAVRRSP